MQHSVMLLSSSLNATMTQTGITLAGVMQAKIVLPSTDVCAIHIEVILISANVC